MNFTAEEAETHKTPVDLGALTETFLREAADDLIQAIQEIRNGTQPRSEEAKKTVRLLKDMYVLAVEERTKVEKLRKSVAGAVGACELDFAAARDEIGSRLARLRDAGSD